MRVENGLVAWLKWRGMPSAALGAQQYESFMPMAMEAKVLKQSYQ